jgi:hypothetical protein
VKALREGLRDGIMEVISTDHAPHTFEDKNRSMQEAPFGIVGLETAACLTHNELVLGGYLTPMQMAACMSYHPAQIVGIDKGDIQPGKAYAAEQGMTCYISMEERMACGIGACLACVCNSKEKDAHSNVKNKRICKEGPVFLAEEVDL